LSANPSIEHSSYYGTTVTHITTNLLSNSNSTAESNPRRNPHAEDLLPTSEPASNLLADTSVSQIVHAGDEICSSSPHDTEQVIEGNDTEDSFQKARNTLSICAKTDHDIKGCGDQFPFDTFQERNMPL